MVDGAKLQRFEDLTVWQESQNLAVLIYTVTRSFPAGEKFGLVNQLRRAASSISANIAEGFGHSSTKDKLHFYTIAYRALLEVKSFTYLAERLEFINQSDVEKTIEQIHSCQKLLNALSSKTKVRP